MITATIALRGKLTASVFIWTDRTVTPHVRRYRITLEGEPDREGTVPPERNDHSHAHMQVLQNVLRIEFPLEPEYRYLKTSVE